MKLLTILFLIFISMAYGQEIVTDLNGFRLGQYREVPHNEFENMIQKERFDDGFEFEVFALEKDNSVTMMFVYAYYNLETIWSIELSGTKQGYDCKFKGLKLGMSAREIEQNLGAPSSVKNMGEEGKKWVYGNTNYSLEFNHAGKLTGIKITDMSQEFFPETDLTKIPNFVSYTQILQSKNKQKISELLAPGIKLSANSSAHYFQKRIYTEIKKDKSGVFKIVERFAESIKNIDPQDPAQYEETVRLELGAAPMKVTRIKTGKKTAEIVFKYMFGKYLIGEINIL